MTVELKACPLCSGSAEIWRAHHEKPIRKAWIACMNRCLVLTKEYETTAEAIAAWNARPREEALEKALRDGVALQRKHYGNATETHIALSSWVKRAERALSHNTDGGEDE